MKRRKRLMPTRAQDVHPMVLMASIFAIMLAIYFNLGGF